MSFSKSKLTLWILQAVLIIISIYYISSILAPVIFNIVNINLGNPYLSVIILLSIITALPILIFLNILLGFYLLGKKPNWWFWGTILLMAYIFLVGVYFIDFNYGKIEEISQPLNDCNSSIVIASIKCSNEARVVLTGERLTCSIYKTDGSLFEELTDIRGNVSFRIIGKVGLIEPLDNLTFVLPNDSEYINFKVIGNNSRYNTTVCGDVGYPYRFPTLEEYKQNMRNFPLYILSLFGIILFSVPTIAVNFEKLWRKGKEKRVEERFYIN